MEENKTVLVAIMNSKRDFEIAQTQNWYRIPVWSAPKIVKTGMIRTIAFYHTKIFDKDKFSIRFYASVKNVSIVKRKELLPDEINDKKAENEYYKIEFAPLIRLRRSIKNPDLKRILFIPTSLEKFYRATEINHLYDLVEVEETPKTDYILKKNYNTILIALMKSRKDFEIARTQKWYRIPAKSAPMIVRNGKMKTIAFYHTKEFNEEKYSVRYYAPVENISLVKRKELFPDEIYHINAENDYYKIEIGALNQLIKPIVSQRGRLIIFIPTSQEKFFNATEINHVFNGTKLEEILWQKLTEKNIAAEREFFYTVNKQYFFLDFAIFCKTRNIDVECDGDKFHTGKADLQYDKNRNNLLESKGWSVLRFTTDNLTNHLYDSMNLVCNTINEYGGVKDLVNLNDYHFKRPDNDPQLLLFD